MLELNPPRRRFWYVVFALLMLVVLVGDVLHFGDSGGADDSVPVATFAIVVILALQFLVWKDSRFRYRDAIVVVVTAMYLAEMIAEVGYGLLSRTGWTDIVEDVVQMVALLLLYAGVPPSG